MAQANYRAGMSRGVSGAFNLGSATRVTINRLVELMTEASGIQPVVQYGPPRKGDVRRQSGRHFRRPKQAFGFEPVGGAGGGLEGIHGLGPEGYGAMTTCEC